MGRTLAGAGCVEVISFPFVGDAAFDALGLPADDPLRRTVRLANPLSTEEPSYTTTLLPGLLRAAARNVGRGATGVSLFETGTGLISRAAGKVMEDPRGQEAVARAVGLAQRGKKRVEQLQERVMEAARVHFRPEFLNRIDETVVFHGLSHEHLRRIVDIQLERLRKRMEARHITVELTDEARDHLILAGYEPDYGARPLKRAIQRELETLIARMVLEGKVRDGQSIRVSASRGALTVEEKQPERAQ